MKTTIACIILLLTFFNTAIAKQISWQTPATVSSVGDISNLGGPIHLAADFNPPETFNPSTPLRFNSGIFDGNINGIQFIGTDQNIDGLLQTNFIGFSGTQFENTFPAGAVNGSTFSSGEVPFYQGPPTGDADLDNLLDSHAFRNVDGFGQLTIQGLNAGTRYQVQLIGIADGRTNAANASVQVDNGDGVFGPVLTRGLYQSVTGEFTAQSTSQTILIEPTTAGGPGLSGIVVQSVPEPSSCCLLFGAMVLTALRRKTRTR